MAREESPREDLIREATALVERIELAPRSGHSTASAGIEVDAPIIVGFRAGGALSVFFGENPVYQFNAAGELRRAYSGGLMLKAMRGQLISLQRVRTTQEVQLLRHELTDREQSDFLTAMTSRLWALAEMLAADEFDVQRQSPVDADILGPVRTWFATHNSWTIAARPNA